MNIGETRQTVAPVYLERYLAAFPCTRSLLFHPLPHSSLTSAAVFRGPRHAYPGGNDLYPGLALWSFPMLLSLSLRLLHFFLRGQVYCKLLSLSGPTISVSCMLCTLLPRATNTHTYTLLSSPDLAWCPGDLVLLGSCFYRASLLAPPLLPSTGFLNLQWVAVVGGWALHCPLCRLNCCPPSWSICCYPRRPPTLP